MLCAIDEKNVLLSPRTYVRRTANDATISLARQICNTLLPPHHGITAHTRATTHQTFIEQQHKLVDKRTSIVLSLASSSKNSTTRITSLVSSESLRRKQTRNNTYRNGRKTWMQMKLSSRKQTKQSKTDAQTTTLAFQPCGGWGTFATSTNCLCVPDYALKKSSTDANVATNRLTAFGINSKPFRFAEEDAFGNGHLRAVSGRN